MNPIIIDFIPVILFFIIYKAYDIYYATAVCIAAVCVQSIYSFKKNKTINKAQLTTLIAVIVLGGATLWLRNEMFIKWKPTIIYWAFSGAFLFSHWFNKQTLTEKILKQQTTLKKIEWQMLNLFCVGIFALMGLINLWVIYHYNTEVWVNFKMFGTLGLTLIFAISIATYIQKKQVKN